MKQLYLTRSCLIHGDVIGGARIFALHQRISREEPVMVELLDPPVAETQSTPQKRGGGPRSLIGRMRARENAVGESLFSKVVFSRKMAIRILDRNALLTSQCTPKKSI